MKLTMWEDTVEKIRRRLGTGEITDKITFNSFEEWNDCFDVKYISDADARASIRVLGQLHNASGDEEYVTYGYMDQAIELEFMDDILDEEDEWL